MSANMDRSLDEILAEKKSDQPRNRRRGGGGGHGGGHRDGGGREGGGRSNRRDDRQDYPRDGVRKSYRDDSRHLDSEWVHDRYEEDYSTANPVTIPFDPHVLTTFRPPTIGTSQSPRVSRTCLKVENLHYELTTEELEGLFARIGPVVRLNLRYDRAGRSEGVAYVTYEYPEDARQAIQEFDGANANGQPIRLSIVSSGRDSRPRGGRNPFDTAVMPGRPLADRISVPSGRSRSLSPSRNQNLDDAATKGIDRYVPGRRSRSPMPRRRGGGGGAGGGGRRPGARKDEGRDQQGGRGGERTRGGRAKKTAEELDDEMADYFGGGGASAAAPAQTGATDNTTAPAVVDDMDMIE
ncbi:hypothetical protein ACHAQH_003917 [Verticillium albo-atrum]